MATTPANESDPITDSTQSMMEYAKPLAADSTAVADADARLHQALQILARSLLRQAQQQLEQQSDADDAYEMNPELDLAQHEPSTKTSQKDCQENFDTDRLHG